MPPRRMAGIGGRRAAGPTGTARAATLDAAVTGWLRCADRNEREGVT